MKKPLTLFASVSLSLLSCLGHAQAKKAATNYLSIPEPISVQGKAYRLSWSSHPDASLYKHEYLSVGDQLPAYKSMVMVDFLLTESTVDQAVATKLSQLEKLKETLPIVQYNVIGNKANGEKIIDCLLSQTAADDRNSVAERTVYRFRSVVAKSGERGVLLFAVSTREYGKAITSFLVKLKTDKALLVNELAKLPMPTVRLSK